MRGRFLMTAGTRPASQAIIEVEAKSLDVSISTERGQARLPLGERGPTVGERRMYQTSSACAERQQGLKGDCSIIRHG